MRLAERETPRPVGALGVEKSREAGNLGAKFAPHGAAIAQRRAASIRLQALGQIGGA